jgi:hypothetical protein
MFKRNSKIKGDNSLRREEVCIYLMFYESHLKFRVINVMNIDRFKRATRGSHQEAAYNPPTNGYVYNEFYIFH